eukprot:5274328-Alexandrium_andersonii.AAC.1
MRVEKVQLSSELALARAKASAPPPPAPPAGDDAQRRQCDRLFAKVVEMREAERVRQENARQWLGDRARMQEQLLEWETWYQNQGEHLEDVEEVGPEDEVEEVFTEGAQTG